MARTKYEVVSDKSQLKEGDVVTIVDLTTGEAHRDATVTYVTTSRYSGGIDARSAGRSSLAYSDLSFTDMSKVVVIRKRATPKNWPPQKNDVWRIDGVIWHYAFNTGMIRVGGGAVGSRPESLLADASTDPELLFRLDK